MTHVQAQRLNSSGRCRNPTEEEAPWLAQEENQHVAVRGGAKKLLLAKLRAQCPVQNYREILLPITKKISCSLIRV